MDTIHQIFNLTENKYFSEDEAFKLLSLFIPITAKAKNKINALNSQLEHHRHLPDVAGELEEQLNKEIQKWSEKIRRLGGTPLSLYEVQIPTQSVPFLWNYPEAELKVQ